MNDLIERLRLGDGTSPDHELLLEAADALEALAQPEQEPVAWEQFYPDFGKPQIAINPETVGYVAPQRKPLTDEDVERIVREARVGEHGIGYTIARAIEAAHGIKEQGDKNE